MARILEDPQNLNHNLRIYDNNGRLLASMQIVPQRRYMTIAMLYRYCRMIIFTTSQRQWAIYFLLQDGSAGRMLDQHSQAAARPGNYIVLDSDDKTSIPIEVTSNQAPRRVTTLDASSRSEGQNERNQLQSHFRRSVRERDTVCAITNVGPATTTPERQYMGLEATHIFPASQTTEWNQNNYRSYITDTSPETEIGQSRLYSVQNGLLLDASIHTSFDAYHIGVDPDADYKIIVFTSDNRGIGGKRLRTSAVDGTTSHSGVSPDIFRWHLRMCVYAHMKASAEAQPYWDEDLGEGDMAEILQQPDAAERMEVELFTRLGPMIA